MPIPRSLSKAMRVWRLRYPAEDELVQVALDMDLAEAVEDSLGPSLEVREDAVRPGQELVRLAALDDANLVRVGGRVLVAQPAVGDDPRAGRHRAPDEAVQRLRGTVGDVRHADTARMPVFGQLDRAGDEDPADRAAPALLAVDRIMPGAERHLRLVDLDEILQKAAVWVDHRAAELVQQEPGALVAAEASCA